MLTPRIEQGISGDFRYIGGQDMAVRTLRVAIAQEIEGIFPVRKPLLLLVGPAGSGKTSLVNATANELNATLVSKTIEDFFSDRGLSLPLIGEGYDEARAAAATNESGKKAVYAIESIDVVMNTGPQPLMSEIFANMMTKWSEDRKGGVLVMATAIEKDCLLPQVLSRFTQVQLTLPDRVRVADMCIKGIERLSAALDRTDIFDAPDGIEDLATRMVDLGWTARDITNFLRSAIALREQESREQKEPWQPIDITFLTTKLPPVSRKFGFRRS